MIVIRLPIKPYVKITSADVTEVREVSIAATVVDRNLEPVRTFFLEYVDHEGCACVWDGATHADALLAANDWAIEGIPVRDHTEDWRRG